MAVYLKELIVSWGEENAYYIYFTCTTCSSTL